MGHFPQLFIFTTSVKGAIENVWKREARSQKKKRKTWKVLQPGLCKKWEVTEWPDGNGQMKLFI